MDPTLITNIEHLLNELYDGGQRTNECSNGTKFEQTNQLLINLQKSKEAWLFVWQLMEKNRSINVQYFGASSLYVKLTKYHYELDTNNYRQIWMKIIENLISYMENPEFNLITTKLISCLAVCIVQNIDSEWNNALQDLWTIFQPGKLPNIPSTRVQQCLLEILSVIPDELNHPYRDKNRKHSAKLELIKHAESVLMFIYTILLEENISDNITKICLKCFQCWSIGLDTIILTENHTEIIAIILNLIRNENTCHEAVECLINIYTNPNLIKQPKMIIRLIEQMTINLRNVIDQAIKESNHDYLRDLYLLFISIGESHTRLILDSLIDLSLNQNIMIEFFHIILKCSQTPNYYGYDETISDLPFNFWINFQDDLMASDENRIQIYLNIFRDIFHSLINIFLFKLQYPPDEIYEQQWDKDDREKFRCYRQDISDTYAYCFSILNTSLLQILMDHFNKALAQTLMASSKNNNDNSKNQISASIRYLEAVIYAFTSLMENISPNENIFMPQILSSFQTLSTECLQDSRLLSTINSFLSNSADWIANNINYFPFSLTIISNSLKSNDQMVIISATMALKIITNECQLNLQPYSMEIIQICEQYLQSQHLQYKERARLMHSLGTILSIIPLDLIMQTIDRILIPILSEMEKILLIDNQQQQQNNTEIRPHINGILLMLSNLFAKLDVNLKGTELEEGDQLISKSLIKSKAKNNIPQPLLKIFEKIMPMFTVIVTNYSYDEQIAENICECIKKTIITLLDDILPMIGAILQLLIQLYRDSRSISVIQISRQIFQLFYKETELLPILQEYFYSLSTITIEQFTKDFRENTYLVQCFYEESAQILRKTTIIFLYSKLNLSALFDWAIAGICLPEKSTVHQCSIFISEFLNQGRQNEQFYKIIQDMFDLLVMKIFIVIGGQQGSPSHSVDYMPDIIIVLNQKYSDNFQRTLNSIIDYNDFPTELIKREQKQQFVQSISTLRNNKRRLREIVKEFSYRCRGLFGVDNKH